VSELKAVDEAGNELPVVPSSIGTTVALSDETDEDGFLDHVWKTVYQLDAPDLAAAIGGRIFRFPFNYRTDASPEEACLLASDGFAWSSPGRRSRGSSSGSTRAASWRRRRRTRSPPTRKSSISGCCRRERT